MNVRCSECKYSEEHISKKGKRLYCTVKGIWIPERKEKRRCGRFESRIKDEQARAG